MIKNRREHKLIGEHRSYTQCRFCSSNKVVPFIDFGKVPLAGGFFKRGSTEVDFRNERLYPMQIVFCPACYLVQVNEVVESDILFKNYFYFSSAIKTLVDHFENFSQELKEIFPDSSRRLIVEIGSNDGVFMKPLKERGFRVVGVDPATNVVAPLIKEGYDAVNDCFTEDVAKEIAKRYGKTDAIVSSYSFAHIDDMHDVMRGVKHLLKNDGILIFEVYYLGTLIKEVQYDMIYHEHHSYYSLLAIKNFMAMYGMEVYDVKTTPLRAGTMRYYVQNRGTGKHRITKAVRDLAQEEKKFGLDKLETFMKYSKYVSKTKKNLLELLERLKKEKKTIIGYGASGRGTAIMSFCGIDAKYLDYIIDDAPAKQGAFTPGNHLPIKSTEVLNDAKERPDYSLVFAWPFIKEIKNRKAGYLNSGGKFIVPLPKVTIEGL